MSLIFPPAHLESTFMTNSHFNLCLLFVGKEGTRRDTSKKDTKHNDMQQNGYI